MSVPFDGLTSDVLSRRLRAPSCLALASVSSVMDVLHELAAEGAPAGTVVLADEQVAGRGRHGRVWHSPAGRNICLAYLVRPERALGSGVLALRVGMAVAGALHDLHARAQLKWPNDVVVKGRKLAGVLCESRGQTGGPGWVAVGIGMNVHGPVAPEVADAAVALEDLVDGVTRVAVLERLVPRLHSLPQTTTLSDSERRRYAEMDWLAGRRVEAPIQGVAGGLAADGALLVNTGTGIQRVVGGGIVAA